VKNIYGNYALIRLSPITVVDTVYEPMPYVTAYMAGYLAHWYLQNNGTTDFSGIQSGVLQNHTKSAWNAPSKSEQYHIGLSSIAAHYKNSDIYTLEGKRIDAAALKNMNAVIIYR
jgi:hypothetical protein